MTANATPMAIRSILRRQQRQEPLNILTFCFQMILLRKL